MNVSVSAQYIYNKFDRSDIVLVGGVTKVEEISGGWQGERNGSERNNQIHFFRFSISASRFLKGIGPPTLEVICPAGFAYVNGNWPRHNLVAVGTTAAWFIRTSTNGDFLLDGSPNRDRPERPRDMLYHLDGAQYGLCMPGNGYAQVVLKDGQVTSRGNAYLDLAELLVRNAAIDLEHRSYYFELLSDLSPVGFGSEDRSKQEQDVFKNWIDAHLHEALNPATDAELMDEYALRIRFGQFEYCDKFTDMFVRTKGIGMTANFPLTLGTNENGLRVYAVAEPRLARELALGFMYCAELSRRRDICKQLIARFDEDHLLDVGILEAVSKLMDWPDVSPYESETHRAFGDLSTQIEIARFRLNN